MKPIREAPVRKQRLYNAAILAAVAIILAVAVGGAVFSFWPLDDIKSQLNALAPDGVANDFPISRIAGIRLKLRILSITAAILGALLFWLDAG